ncbi:MAG: hypothetical protein CSA89_01150 [Bacteroidales bacterium]|nr:MAG: hypothetical protein CSA89_01150 [Bacteroidales bacterium]
MKRTTIFFILIANILISYGQDIKSLGGLSPKSGDIGGGISMPQKSSQANEEAPKIKPTDVKCWTIDERYAIADTTHVDTIVADFPNNNAVARYSIANSWTGNLGSPVQSKTFFDRTKKTSFLLSNPYDAYAINIENIRFYNTKSPYANLTYKTSFPRYKEEDDFRAIYSMNFNKHLNLGGLFNFTLGRGIYPNQVARAVNGGIFSSFDGKRYEFNSAVIFNDFRNRENGGIKNVEELSSKSKYSYLETNIPESVEATSTYKSAIFFINQKYSLGFDKERQITKDSTIYDFVPVTSFIHSFKYENAKKRYTELLANNYYDTAYYSQKYTKDSVRHQEMNNSFAITLDEKFNTFLRFGLAFFVRHELLRNTIYSDDKNLFDRIDNTIYVGGKLSKTQGQVIKYKFDGQIGVVGLCKGEFAVGGNIETNFKLFADTISLSANGKIMYYSPDFYMYRLFSNHFKWENSLSNYLDTRVGGRFQSKITGISLGFNVANIKQFLYFDHKALPAQFDGNIQVVALDIKANMRLHNLHFDNTVVYQISSNSDILPLPEVAIYSNLYYSTRFFKKILTVQFGVSGRYHSAYYGNAYMPSTGQFYLQNQTLIGNYPDLNAYLNIHLKRIRIYVQYSHLNMYRFGGNGFMLMPNYPINPATIQMGLSWNFYN